MADTLFTSGLKSLKDKNLPKDIRSALKELRQGFPSLRIEAYSWLGFVLVPLKVQVNLPTRGTADNVDIRNTEPVFLLFDKEQYPLRAPLVFSNRLSFPKDRLPHLNPHPKDLPANFCLYRGSLDAWFLEHSLIELVDKAKSWLEDAAGGNLMRDSDRFEVTRIDDMYGFNTFEYSKFESFVREFWKNRGGCGGFKFLRYQVPDLDPQLEEKGYTINFQWQVFEENIDDDIENARDLNQFMDEYAVNHPHARLPLSNVGYRSYGLLIWSDSDNVSDRYMGTLPNTLDEFIRFADCFGLNITEPLNAFFSKGLNLSNCVPVTIAIQRPQKLMNHDSEIELLSFLLKFPEGKIEDINLVKKETIVKVLGHVNPLTVHRAREISGSHGDADYGRVLFLGCGAVGSKMILHFARSGYVNCSIVDTDVISPHNLVRHGLLRDSVGRNKAVAMSETIKEIFSADSDSAHVEPIKKDAIDLLLNDKTFPFKKYQWIIDASASPVVQRALTVAKLPESLHCCRCEIAYSGKLGFMSIEGSGRRPRLDDIQAFAFDKAIESDEISKWLQANRDERESELGSRLQEVSIGVSCSSETMRLSDEIVSLHSAAFTAGFKKIAKEDDFDEGYVQINCYDESKESPFYYSHFRVPRTVTLNGRNKSTWEVRLIGDTEKTLRGLFSSAKPNETGGILIGFVNWHREAVYITRALKPPSDSSSSPFAFVRGISDVPDEVEHIHERTGAMLGYIGEWHTHPGGEPQPSPRDLSTVGMIKPNLDKARLPALLLIVTDKGIYPYIYP